LVSEPFLSALPAGRLVVASRDLLAPDHPFGVWSINNTEVRALYREPGDSAFSFGDFLLSRHIDDTIWAPSDGNLLSRHFGPKPPRVHAHFGARSHPGLVRTRNEDHYVVIERHRSRLVLLTNLPEDYLRPSDDVAYLMAVADGLGGAAFGELASMLALRSGWDQASNAIKWTWVITDEEIADLREQVELVFRRIHEDLLAQGREDPKCAGMGTTLTAAYTVGPEAFIAHVGDSRAYLFHDGLLTRLTRDHTLAEEALAVGVVPSRSWYHMLTNCLGGSKLSVRVEFHQVRLADSDQLLLCTDGLTNLVPEKEISDILMKGASPPEAVEALILKALARGGGDNITAVLARYEM
jgi:serine/threonine protein phosphatase PrpC